MSLTRELLEELELTEPVIGRILDAHESETTRIRGEFDAFRREVEQQRIAGQRQAVIRAALRDEGANEAAVPLLALAVTTSEEDWEGASLRDASAILAPVREQYAAFFSASAPLPTDPLAPPLDGAPLTLADVRGMSASQINDNWSQICAALAHRS